MDEFLEIKVNGESRMRVEQSIKLYTLINNSINEIVKSENPIARYELYSLPKEQGSVKEIFQYVMDNHDALMVHGTIVLKSLTETIKLWILIYDRIRIATKRDSIGKHINRMTEEGLEILFTDSSESIIISNDELRKLYNHFELLELGKIAKQRRESIEITSKYDSFTLTVENAEKLVRIPSSLLDQEVDIEEIKKFVFENIHFRSSNTWSIIVEGKKYECKMSDPIFRAKILEGESVNAVMTVTGRLKVIESYKNGRKKKNKYELLEVIRIEEDSYNQNQLEF